MRFRKFFLKLRLWTRLRIERRRVKRALREVKAVQANCNQRIAENTVFYEKQLATERKRFELVHTEWANRFLQRDRLPPVSLATIDLDEKVQPHLRSQKPQNETANELFTKDQSDYFDNTKQMFFAQGREQGKDDADINYIWESTVKAQAIIDTHNAVEGLN